ncbi:MAG TPA: DegT/DnrJ/EryC1/StrS family aminotransferase [Thermoanaerobaculia bacterium]|nr:DegT/DnrJ/EryC1/StrS family aminotransferase [Thermoanaerobaculia bacterium]
MIDLDWPLMRDNFSRDDLDAAIEILKREDPILTQSREVEQFEEEWSRWLGTKHSVFVNSGSSANFITMAAIRALHGDGEVIVPTLGWVSDVAAVLMARFDPVFVDIDRRTLGMDPRQVIDQLTPRTRAVLLVHILGYNALTRELLDELDRRGIALIEDTCESHGATFEGRKLGTFGLASNFSFYYAHHMSTVEGGMISTDDAEFYETCRMFRAHGMVRESKNAALRKQYTDQNPDLNPDFIFAYPGFNNRGTEIQAAMGRSQLKRLDAANELRRANLTRFLSQLDSTAYQTDFATDGSCNYAFTLVLQKPDEALRDRVVNALRAARVEFRRGTSGGGNQVRQPYLKHLNLDPKQFPVVDHVHFFGFYIGNYPGLESENIDQLCALLNSLV